MKYLMKVKIPNDKGNDMIKDTQFAVKMRKALEEIKAEAAYFTSIDGTRGGYFVVEMNDASQLPQLAEPFYLWLNAEIDIIPVMTPQDLQKASQYIESAVKNWG